MVIMSKKVLLSISSQLNHNHYNYCCSSNCYHKIFHLDCDNCNYQNIITTIAVSITKITH